MAYPWDKPLLHVRQCGRASLLASFQRREGEPRLMAARYSRCGHEMALNELFSFFFVFCFFFPLHPCGVFVLLVGHWLAAGSVPLRKGGWWAVGGGSVLASHSRGRRQHCCVFVERLAAVGRLRVGELERVHRVNKRRGRAGGKKKQKTLCSFEIFTFSSSVSRH